MISCPDCGRQWPDQAHFCMDCGTLLTALAAPRERRVVTTLLCDLPGLISSSDPAHPGEVTDVLREYHAVVGGIIGGFGGSVDRTDGDDVAAVFGLSVVHRDDAERAVRAGLRIVDDLEGLTGPDGARLKARVGVSTGEALVLRGAASGPGNGLLDEWAISMAACVVAAAPPGHVAVGALTQRLTAGAFDYESLPVLSNRRDSDRVAAWLAKAPAARPRVRWTARGHAVGRPATPADARGAG